MLHDIEAFRGNKTPKRQLSLSIFVLGLVKRRLSEKSMIGEEWKVSAINWGKLSETRLCRCFSASLCLQRLECSVHPGMGGGQLSQESFMTCFKGGKRSESPSYFLLFFSNSLNLKYSICQSALFGGSKSWNPSSSHLPIHLPSSSLSLFIW